MGNDVNVLSLEAMKNMFEIAATNLKLEWERGDPKDNPLPSKLQPGDAVLVQNHVKGPFDPKYIGDYRVVSLKGNQVEVQLQTEDQQRWNTSNMLNMSYLLTDILNNYQIILYSEEKWHSEWILIIFQIYIGT